MKQKIVKMLACVLALALVLGLMGCGSSDETQDAAETQPAAETVQNDEEETDADSDKTEADAQDGEEEPTDKEADTQTDEEADPDFESEIYVYPVKDSEIRITTLDANRCEADGGYLAHGQYVIKSGYLVCYGPCEEDSGVKAIWAYMAGDADLEELGGMASAFRIEEDNTLTKVTAYGLALRGNQALFVYDEETPDQIMLITFYEGNAYDAVGPCINTGAFAWLYGDVTGGDASWGPMLWPSVKGAYEIIYADEENDIFTNNVFHPLESYDLESNESIGAALFESGDRAILINRDGEAAYAVGAGHLDGETLTLEGEASEGDAALWSANAGSYHVDLEALLLSAQ